MSDVASAVVNLAAKFEQFGERWSPRVVGELNGEQVKLAKLEGEFYIVARGVEHRPVATAEAHVLMMEPAMTLNTGNLRNERTVDSPARL